MTKSKKTYTNAQISELLQNIATAYEIKNKNKFRIISYQNAADNILTLSQSVQQIWQDNPKALDNIPGVGEAIIEKLDYLFTKDKLHPHITQAFNNIHPAVFTFTKINGIGPKIAFKLTQHLQFPKEPVKSLEKLLGYAKKGKIRTLPTMGEKSETQILDNTLSFLGRKERMNYNQASQIAAKLISYMQQKFPSTEFVALGSLRRHSPSVGDIDIAAQSNQANPIIDHFLTYPDIVQVISHGAKKASVRLLHDIRLDLMVQPKTSWGSLLVHFTGSRQHNILLRRYALTLGLSISEYGIKDLKTGRSHHFTTEKSFYKFLGLRFISPENRLGEKEIETSKMLIQDTNK